jgi:hypothetical protein
MLAIIALALFVGCGVATWWQIQRALAGNALSEFYMVMWPCYAGYVVYVWIRLRVAAREESTPPDSALPPVLVPQDDPEVAAYNQYLAARRVEATSLRERQR